MADYEIGADDDLSDVLDAMSGVPKRRVKARGQMIAGIGSTSVGATSTSTITTALLETFRPRKLVLEAACRVAGCFVTDIKIGRSSQLAGAGTIPCGVFTPDATVGGLKGDTASPQTGINLSVSNTTAGAIVFSGAFYGEVA